MEPSHIISNMAYPCADGVHHRTEIVYHESLDLTILSTTPIVYDGTKYAPLSSTVSHIITRFVFTDYQFHSSLDFGVRLEQFCSWYFEDTMKIGKVIKIEIPLLPPPTVTKKPAVSSLSTSKATRRRKTARSIDCCPWETAKRPPAESAGWAPPPSVTAAREMNTSFPSAPSVWLLYEVPATPTATSDYLLEVLGERCKGSER
ncbi:hypothetical protein BKA57DRAFT_526697 [Linnemannia elongata]|nr:hypothetical protein BKA57DRAFT_526697 [Linnemannia elongata]